MAAETEKKKRTFGCLQVLGIVAAVVLVTALLTAWWVKHNIYASEFSPVELTSGEKKTLEAKLESIDEASDGGRPLSLREPSRDGSMVPEPYSEEGARREISLTEKELNGLVAKDPEMAKHVAIDLAKDLVSVKLIVPVEEDVFLLGGKTLRLKMGMTMAYEANRPVVALKGVSLGGVPLPNAWLGNLKRRNLVAEYGSDAGFWKFFADGVEDIKVEEGHILVRLKE